MLFLSLSIYATQAIKLQCAASPIFLLAWSLLVAVVCVAGSHAAVQYFLLVLALTALHSCDRTLTKQEEAPVV